ncbi:MAG: FAD:protein FMN transferase [Opitutae bacterium]|nr:FAD:protein FMN transferase [Opitutae bacterium]
MKPPLHVFRHNAMATHFEVRVAGGDATYARQAAQASFAAADRIEGLLSRYDETSEISCLNRLPPGEAMRVSEDTFACLRQALEMHVLTGGAFDATLGRAMDRLRGKAPDAAPDEPRGRLVLDPATQAVLVEGGAVALDLGAIGKGFALDRMADVLREWEVPRALLVSGGSSILALDAPAAGQGWAVTVGDATPPQRLCLINRAIGSSGTTVQGQHILDPLTGRPAQNFFRTWALAANAAEADALSTAWMSLTAEEIAEVCRLRPGVGAVLQTAPEPVVPLIFLGAAAQFLSSAPR